MVGRALPAADTRHDPLLVDLDDVTRSTARKAPDGSMPAAASAADVVSDDLRSPSNRADPPAASPKMQARAQDDDDAIPEYFDTAPIPGVDVTQTSDRPRGANNKH